MSTPTVYLAQRDADLFVAVDGERDVRRAWGVKSVVGGEFRIFMTRRRAEEYSERYNLAEAFAVDVLTRAAERTTTPTLRMNGQRVMVIADFANDQGRLAGDFGVTRSHEIMRDGSFAYLVAFNNAVPLWVMGKYLEDA